MSPLQRVLLTTGLALACGAAGCGGGGTGNDAGTGGGMDSGSGGNDTGVVGRPDVGPGIDGGCVPSVELCGDHIDENCDGMEDPCGDNDGDHFDACRPTDTDLTMCDCNDRDRNTYPPRLSVPGGHETCDGLDNDCDTRIDESSDCCAGCAGIEASRADACTTDGMCDCLGEPGVGACPAGQTCCTAGCIDTTSDANNCGACRATCGFSADRCTASSCMCGTGSPCSGSQNCTGGSCG